MDTYVQFMYATWEENLNEKLREQRLKNQFQSEKVLVKKLAIVNALSFDMVLPKSLMIDVFEYMGADNKRLARQIARNSFTRPNLTTAENRKIYIQQMSQTSGSFKKFLVLFRKNHPEDQATMLNISVANVLKLFHVPKKMVRTITEALTGIKKERMKKSKKSRKKAPAVSWMSRDPFAPRQAVAVKEKEPQKSKLQRFNDAIAEYQRINKRNTQEMRRASGLAKFDAEAKRVDFRLLEFDW